ncbi:hypothetical protein GCM10008090_12130 [Arenicella chitinivorans]|uniref:N-acetyltransferase domain-containing protein n=1 Tax=Arenicella chitinivorans TaxID=1329800 RepID=A0A918VIK0_9GAMM|nr:GNAT family N-acetyltransferase [Arenicella chitinivorans]GHA04356.1 hypothetical protein GCM10008090_12130 [Arenicella chitinivorans]
MSVDNHDIAMQFEALSQEHVALLLQFESQNRDYFEQFIAPRPAGFYTEAGVQAHIQSALAQSGERGRQFYVAIKEHHIIARANLKRIVDDHYAEIGYRVSERAAGSGVASACVAFLVETARNSGLQTLSAIVMSNNRASERVLRKNQFDWVQSQPNAHMHRGDALHGFVYQRRLLDADSG